MKPVKRIAVDTCLGVLIDYQDFFLSQLEARERSRIRAHTKNLVRLLSYFRVPIVATTERPVDDKGSVPRDVSALFGERAKIMEKDFFDLTKEKKIRDHIARSKKKQMIVAGSETDVCVLQSCLGLLGLGYEVYLVEETLFSSSRNVEAAIARLKAAGATFVTYKTLFYEFVEAVEGSPHVDRMFRKLGDFPDIPDTAEDERRRG